MVKTSSEAVRPSLNVASQEETNKNSLSHHGDTAIQTEITQQQDKESTKSSKEDEEREEMKDEGEYQDKDEEEAQEAVTRRAPKGPTKEEREKHEATHLPFREWCQHCIRGRGRNKPHKKKTEEEKEGHRVSRVSMDYFFMSQEEEKASQNPLMVMIDEEYGNRYMRAVGKKGLGEGNEMDWLIKDMHEELKSWGYPGGENNELILKSDGEPAIVAVRERLSRYHGGKITPEQPTKGESSSNGKVEEAGKTTRSLVKVFKDMIEDKTGQEIESDCVVMLWLVRWAAMLYSRFKIGTDGKTSYERQ